MRLGLYLVIYTSEIQNQGREIKASEYRKSGDICGIEQGEGDGEDTGPWRGMERDVWV